MKGLSASLEQEGYRVVCASAFNNKVFRLLDMVKATIKYGYSMDVVLIDTYSTSNFYYALVVSQLCRVLNLPYIPILHGGNLPERLKNNPKLCELLFKHAKCLVSPSLYLESVFKVYGYSNVDYIPNSLQIQNYPFSIRSINDFRLLWVRSFCKIYNPCLAVDVLKSLQDRGHTAKLCMVGPDTDGSLAIVKQYAKAKMVQVETPGKLSKSEWTTLAKDYNVFINTTNFDNMPVSVIEGMALGLPIVSTNVGGMPFLIQDGVDGVLVPPKNIEAFVSALLHLKAHPEQTKAMVLAAREKVSHFDWEVVKNQWQQVLGDGC